MMSRTFVHASLLASCTLVALAVGHYTILCHHRNHYYYASYRSPLLVRQRHPLLTVFPMMHRVLLKAGVMLHHDQQGHLLTQICIKGFHRIARDLLMHNVADASKLGHQQQALMEACRHCRVETVGVLITYGRADPNARGGAPLMIAMEANTIVGMEVARVSAVGPIQNFLVFLET